jgi:hypothetical protein
MTSKKARRMSNCAERQRFRPFKAAKGHLFQTNLKHGKSPDFRDGFKKTSTW